MAVKARESEYRGGAGAVLLLRALPNIFPHVQQAWADAGNIGNLAGNIKTHLGWTLKIVKHPWSG